MKFYSEVKLICPDCKTVVYDGDMADFASMGEIKRRQFNLIVDHKKANRCNTESTPPSPLTQSHELISRLR